MVQETEQPTVTFENLAWLVGQWQGEGFGGVCDEIWQPAEAGSMMGTFRLVQNGSVIFYELMIITIENGAPILRLKHFNADMTGWETKDEVITFGSAKVEPNKVEFEGLTYSLVGEDALTIVVHTSGHGEATLKLHRVKK
jgi:hypothetical protein